MKTKFKIDINEESKKKIKIAVLFLVVVAVISIIVNLLTDGEGTICIISNTTGVPCPSCGLTRSVIYMLQFKFKEAFLYHPLVYLLPIWIPLLGYGVIKENGKLVTYTIYSIGLVGIILWAVRMYLYFPNVDPMTYRWGSVFGTIISTLQNLVDNAKLVS